MLTVLKKGANVRFGQVLVSAYGEAIAIKRKTDLVKEIISVVLMPRPVLLLCCFGCLIDLGSARAQFGNTFLSENFQGVRVITLSDPDGLQSEDLLISEIRSLDVDSSGRLLVVDLPGSQAFLFGSDGNLLSVLDPSLCHPGFELRPANALEACTRILPLQRRGI